MRFLAEQVKSSPEDAELREVYAGALYLAERLPDAKQQLSVAANLEAPAWRVAYHRGLFKEAGRKSPERADWEVALARRDGIIVAGYRHSNTLGREGLRGHSQGPVLVPAR